DGHGCTGRRARLRARTQTRLRGIAQLILSANVGLLKSGGTLIWLTGNASFLESEAAIRTFDEPDPSTSRAFPRPPDPRLPPPDRVASTFHLARASRPGGDRAGKYPGPPTASSGLRRPERA